jgi:hypothetical protein
VQRYEDPNTIAIPANTRTSKLQKKCLQRDGQITPILVINGEAADEWQAERVQAARELEWPTILTEDEFTPEDLL